MTIRYRPPRAHVDVIMAAETSSRILVPDAEEADIPALTAIKGEGTEALHRDRLHDAQQIGFRYLVLDHEHTHRVCLSGDAPPSFLVGCG